MRSLARWLGMVLASLLLGSSSAWWAVSTSAAHSVRNGAWTCNPLAGARAQGLYSRAQVVAAGPLALSRDEAIYWTATTDDRGSPLRCGADYDVEVPDVNARWWSITAYDPNGFLIANSPGRYSFNSVNIRPDPRGRLRLHLSRSPHRGNWIPTGSGERFYLTLRLYGLEPSLQSRLGSMPLPSITLREPAS